MDLEAFRDSLGEASPPAGASRAVQALWHEARGHEFKSRHSHHYFQILSTAPPLRGRFCMERSMKL